MQSTKSKESKNNRNGKNLNKYLEKIEKYLKLLVAFERVDIEKEIKSEMLELQGKVFPFLF